MSIYRSAHALLAVTSETDSPQTGTAYTVLPEEADGISDANQSFKAFFDVTQSGGATSPTTDVHLQTSHDGTNWVNVVSATQLTADGAVHEFKDVSAIGPFVRAVSALGGGTAPNHTVTVKLASNGPFRLLALS